MAQALAASATNPKIATCLIIETFPGDAVPLGRANGPGCIGFPRLSIQAPKINERFRGTRMDNRLFDLSGKVAVVTGGNGGIGLGMAKGLAGAGATIVVGGRDAAKNADAVKQIEAIGGKAAALPVDVLKEESCRALIADTMKAHGRLDILVNNAGMSIRKQPEELALAEWHTVLDSNLTSAFLCSNAAFPAMKKARAGKIINIGSMRMSIPRAPRDGLCGEQGRHGPDDQVDGDRVGQGQHPGECDPARLDRHRFTAARASR